MNCYSSSLISLAVPLLQMSTSFSFCLHSLSIHRFMSTVYVSQREGFKFSISNSDFSTEITAPVCNILNCVYQKDSEFNQAHLSRENRLLFPMFQPPDMESSSAAKLSGSSTSHQVILWSILWIHPCISFRQTPPSSNSPLTLSSGVLQISRTSKIKR